MIPKGVAIPDTLALLQDTRNVEEGGDYYHLVPSVMCEPDVFEKNFAEFFASNGYSFKLAR